MESKLAERLLLALAVLEDARGLLDEAAAVLGGRVQDRVEVEQHTVERRRGRNRSTYREVAHLQVRRSVEGVIECSTALREQIEQAEVGRIGAMYDVASGAVHFMDTNTWMCGDVRHFFLDANGLAGAAAIPPRRAVRRGTARRR